MKKKDAPSKVRDAFQALDKSVPFQGPEAIETRCLECFEYAYRGRAIDVVTTTDEFTSVCPFSGLPDFARVTITYTPHAKCIELRSLKYYLMSYRNVGIWYEHLVNRMLEDLVRACDPVRMSVVIACNPRGGLASSVSAEYERSQGR
ncbi:MAG TPA: preQ(1) synthase [Candidatus Hydrogenedentes bacterium]|nr:preQ(1) synthase [Candidatus Hydrogenedentota bacterium]HOS02780.1 preQ(1) synthase [Candidatus Hydrogenedentota bacterium]